MSQQLHKRFSVKDVTETVLKYQNKEMTGTAAAAYLGIGRTRFYEIVAEVEKQGSAFTLEYKRKKANNRIDQEVENNLRKELEEDKKLIENSKVPVKRYNYSYVCDQLTKNHQQEISLTTTIARAKEWGYWLGKPPKKSHDRQVITNYTGELIQHDASHHLFAPLMERKLVLTTSLDDFSRALLYADFWEHETTWNHLQAAHILVGEYGIPHRFYVDQHRIFRYVKSRDKASPWREFNKFTDDVDPQYKRALKELNIDLIYALSPQAKGKIERPYQWLQDRVVRTCMRENVTTIEGAREVLNQIVYQYNWKWRHSTTNEIPMERFQDAIRERKSLWRPVELSSPYTGLGDIFCLRTTRIVDPYHYVSINNFKLQIPNVPPRHEVELRMTPDLKRGTIEVRCWFNGVCVDRITVKSQELPIVQF
jgi:hypothetical protein